MQKCLFIYQCSIVLLANNLSVPTTYQWCSFISAGKKSIQNIEKIRIRKQERKKASKKEIVS